MAVYNVVSYGATGNGTTDDTAAINAAIAACGTGTAAGIVLFPAGTYRITSTVSVSSKTGCTLRGEGAGATYIKNSSRTANAVTFSACAYCGVESLTIFNDRSAGNPTAGYAIEFNGNCYGSRVASVNISYCFNGIRNLSCTETRVREVLIRGIYGAYGLNFVGSAAVPCYGMVVEDFITDPLDTGNVTVVGINNDSYAYSLSVRRAALLGGGYGFVMTDSINNGSSAPLFAELIDLECDHNKITGVLLNAGDEAYLTSCWVGSCLNGNGIYVAPTFKGEFGVTTTRIVGNAQHGILINSGPTGNVISTSTIGINSQVTYNTYHGITLGTSQADTVISGCKIGAFAGFANPQAYGVYVSTGCNGYVVASNNLRGNVTTGIFNGGTTPNVVANNVL